MRKLILTRIRNLDIQATLNDGVLEQLTCYPYHEPISAGQIVIGKVKNIKASIQAAFIEYAEGENGFYDLKKQPLPLITNRPSDGRLLEGDEVLVQIEREASRGKAPLLSGKYTLTGKYSVLTRGNTKLSVSSQWKHTKEGEEAKKLMAPYENDEYGFILRTNAKELSPEKWKSALEQKAGEYKAMKDQAAFRTVFSTLWQPLPSYLEAIRDRKEELQVVTDLKEVYESILAYAKAEEPELIPFVGLYEDSFPLAKLHSLESRLEDHLQKKVWLKSGGFLTIEQTEAMVVIDVNSGKAAGKGTDSEETYYRLNVEAANVIADELRIRNLSGIILIDFVDMKKEEHKEALLQSLKGFCKTDPIHTEVVDMTRLGLVEMTRKKVKKTLKEQANFFKKEVDNSGTR